MQKGHQNSAKWLQRRPRVARRAAEPEQERAQKDDYVLQKDGNTRPRVRRQPLWRVVRVARAHRDDVARHHDPPRAEQARKGEQKGNKHPDARVHRRRAGPAVALQRFHRHNINPNKKGKEEVKSENTSGMRHAAHMTSEMDVRTPGI